jgi:hypothetical protein
MDAQKVPPAAGLRWLVEVEEFSGAVVEDFAALGAVLQAQRRDPRSASV